jgi:hypothetical protein
MIWRYFSFVFWLSMESQSQINKDNDISNTCTLYIGGGGPRKVRNQVIWKNSCSVPGAYSKRRAQIGTQALIP